MAAARQELSKWPHKSKSHNTVRWLLFAAIVLDCSIIHSFLEIIICCQVFTYPNNLLTLDLALLFFMALLEVIRLYFGTKGNLTEEEGPLGISLGITIGSVILSAYFLVWQTYILRADVIINVVLLVAYGLEGILQIIAIAAFVS